MCVKHAICLCGCAKICGSGMYAYIYNTPSTSCTQHMLQHMYESLAAGSKRYRRWNSSISVSACICAMLCWHFQLNIFNKHTGNSFVWRIYFSTFVLVVFSFLFCLPYSVDEVYAKSELKKKENNNNNNSTRRKNTQNKSRKERNINRRRLPNLCSVNKIIKL